MLKTVDILIGTVTVLVIFSMAVTVITQAFTGILNRKGNHLRDGISSLLRQLGISNADVAKSIAEKVLKHPMVSCNGRLGTVIHREEFTKLLLDLASGEGAVTLEGDAKAALVDVLKKGGISDPAEGLKNIHYMAAQLEAANPELANHLREAQAVLHGVPSQFVSRVHSWFDQSIDRVSDRFTQYTHAVVMGISLVVVLFVQLDIIAVVERLSIDDQLRSSIVTQASNDFSKQVTDASDPKPYYDLLGKAGLVALPVGSFRNWWIQIKESRKWPGMLISVLLLSLGAPFWYKVLGQLLQLRSAIAGKDDAQRDRRQGVTPLDDGASSGTQSVANRTPIVASLPRGESGDQGAVG